MARYRATVDTSQPREEVFGYLSDFSTTQQWDPGVSEAAPVSGSAVGEGAEFRVVATLLGRRHELTYRTVEYEHPRSVAFVAETPAVVSRDRITFEPIAEGTRVTYDAEMMLKGPLRVAEPVLNVAFTQLGDRALAGLRRTLAPAKPQQLIPLSGRALGGQALELPRDLAKLYNVVVVAFGREQQPLVEEWVAWALALERERPDVAAYEVSVLSGRYAAVRHWIDGGTTRGVPGAADRARTITVHANVGHALHGLGLPDTSTITTVLAERSGRVRARELGGFDESKARRLSAALPLAAGAAAPAGTPRPGPTRHGPTRHGPTRHGRLSR